MHELSVTKSLIDIIDSECRENRITPKKIIAELGTLTSFKPDPIIFYYDILKKENSLLRDSILVIESVQGKIKCNECKKESMLEDNIMIFCPKCKSSDVEIISGRDFKLKEVIGK